jgi:hypothetical protein
MFDEGIGSTSWITIEVGPPSINSTDPLKEIVGKELHLKGRTLPSRSSPNVPHHLHHNRSNQYHTTLIA